MGRAHTRRKRDLTRARCVQIGAACEDIQEGYRPPITFIVVRKRHGTRMYPVGARVDPNENLPPGIDVS